MATKKEFTTKDLEMQCEEARQTFERLSVLLKEQKQKEAVEKQAKLAAEKEARYKEVIDAYENFEELRSKYVDDYGRFTFEAKCTDGDLCDWIFRHAGLI